MHRSEESFDKSVTVAGIAASLMLGFAGAHSQSSTGQGGSLLPVRWLSGRLRGEGRRRAQASSGGARCGPS